MKSMKVSIISFDRKKQKKEVMIDGYAGFILLDKNGNPKVAMYIQKVV